MQEGGHVIINLTKTKRIVKGYYEQGYANKLNMLDDMDKFPESTTNTD